MHRGLHWKPPQSIMLFHLPVCSFPLLVQKENILIKQTKLDIPLACSEYINFIYHCLTEQSKIKGIPSGLTLETLTWTVNREMFREKSGLNLKLCQTKRPLLIVCISKTISVQEPLHGLTGMSLLSCQQWLSCLLSFQSLLLWLFKCL